MAATPEWKVYDEDGKYQAACKEVEAAGALVSFYGAGSTIRHEHTRPVWTEGVDGWAGESYDVVAEVVAQHMEEHYQAWAAKERAKYVKAGFPIPDSLRVSG